MKTLLLALFSLTAAVHQCTAGNRTKGQRCNPGSSRLQEGTYQFWSECDSVTYCSDQGICQPKRCRRDDFPFGYNQTLVIPDKCPLGMFCPDEGTDCQPLLPVGKQCQFNRDDQCAPPPNFDELADTLGRGLNFNGSVCLNNKCLWANATLGNKCTVENTAYVGYTDVSEFQLVVSRGNCRIGMYCDAQTLSCARNKLFGEQCDADKECESYNCLASGVCGDMAGAPKRFGVYDFILVGFGIGGGMGITLLGLYVTHKRQREIERAKRVQYWKEQNVIHQNLANMRQTAKTPIQYRPEDSNSTEDGHTECHSSVESHMPMLGGRTRVRSPVPFRTRTPIDTVISEDDDYEFSSSPVGVTALS